MLLFAVKVNQFMFLKSFSLLNYIMEMVDFEFYFTLLSNSKGFKDQKKIIFFKKNKVENVLKTKFK